MGMSAPADILVLSVKIKPMILSRPLQIISTLILFAVFLTACASQPTTVPALDINAASTQAVATIMAGITLTAQAALPAATATETPIPAPTATATPDPNRTPPPLPAAFTTDLLNPLDTPHTYIQDACQGLKSKWDSHNAAPGTVLMPIMLHSIVKGEVAADNYNAISMGDFRKLMNDLKDAGFEAIDMQQAADFLYNNAKIPQRSVLLIVDDRHYRAYFDDTFAKYYKEWGWKVVNSWINADDSIYTLTIQENVALEKEGWVDHQSHGYVHNIPMDDNSTDEYLKGELQSSMEKMQKDYNKTPIAIIWPGGGFGKRPVEAARQYGYKLGFTINPRGPLLFNWIPQADAGDEMRPSFIPEGAIGDPLLTLPRYWDTDARTHLDTVRNISKAAAAYAASVKATELEYYDIVCAPTYGALP
jgi:hypothetical protein